MVRLVRFSVACLSYVVDVPFFQHDWCSIVIEFSSDSSLCLTLLSKGIVFPVRSFFLQCSNTDASHSGM